jgi:hypothetical protein
MRLRLCVALAVIALVSTVVPRTSGAATIIDAAALSSVACAVHGQPCFAVGFDAAPERGVIVKIVNGQPSAPIPVPGILLFSVTCMNGGDCAAVGMRTGGGAPELVFFDVDGQPTQFVSLAGTGALGPIACPTPTTCLVFGSRVREFEERVPTLTIVRKAQSSATTVDFPSPTLVANVACPTSTRCVATGVGFDVALSGPHWTTTVITAPFLFDGIDCPTQSQCLAVTRVFQNNFPFGAIAPIDIDGTVGAPAAMAQFGTTFFAIGCVDRHLCFAVGENERTTRGTIVRVVDGLPGPPTDVDGVNFFAGVACTDKVRLCTAIGRALTGEPVVHSFAA